MMSKLFFLILFFISFSCLSQVRDTIVINNVEYEIIIDTRTHKVRECWIIEEETFIEKLYIGFTSPLRYGSYEQVLIWDCSEWGKVSLGYDFGHKTTTIGAYISLGRLHKRRDKINAVYF